MTRRDTIIIAVFINAAILIALFVSAMRSKSDDKELAAAPEATQKPIELPLAKTDIKPELKVAEAGKSEIKAAEGDEVDLVLKQFAQSAPQLAQAPAPEALAAQPGQHAAPVDFAQDLNALMTPAAPPVVAAVPSEPTAAVPAASLINVTVKKGDALEKIARAHKTTVREIMRLNNLKNANLRVGQVLKVSQGSGRQKVAASSSAAGTPKYYTVKNGDNPWTIAVKNHLKVEELLRLNNMDEQRARHLKAGDKIRIQ